MKIRKVANSLIPGSRIAATAPPASHQFNFSAENEKSTTASRLEPERPKIGKSVNFFDEPEIIESPSSASWRSNGSSIGDTLDDFVNDATVCHQLSIQNDEQLRKLELDFGNLALDIPSFGNQTDFTSLTSEMDTANRQSKPSSRSITRSKPLLHSLEAEPQLAYPVKNPSSSVTGGVNRMQKPQTMQCNDTGLGNTDNRELSESGSYKFKATPVPPSVYLPLYDDLVQQRRSRSVESRNSRKQELFSMLQPFSLNQRSSVKLKASSSARLPKKSASFDSPRPKSAAKVQASPALSQNGVSSSNFDKTGGKFEKEPRRISRSPSPRIARQCRSAPYRPSFRPHVTSSVPDFDAEYHQFLRKCELNRSAVEPTRSSPFSFRTDARIRERTELKEIEKALKQFLDEELTQRLRKRPDDLRSFYRDDIPAIVTNRTVELRCSQRRDEAQEERRAELDFLERQAEKTRRMNELRLRITSADCGCVKRGKHDPYGVQERWEQRADLLKNEQRSQDRQYEAELLKIRRRVFQRPTLAEQQREQAKRSAEKQ